MTNMQIRQEEAFCYTEFICIALKKGPFLWKKIKKINLKKIGSPL